MRKGNCRIEKEKIKELTKKLFDITGEQYVPITASIDIAKRLIRAASGKLDIKNKELLK